MQSNNVKMYKVIRKCCKAEHVEIQDLFLDAVSYRAHWDWFPNQATKWKMMNVLQIISTYNDNSA